MEAQDNDVTVMFIGDTGSGKSSVGNLFLGEKVFEESQKPQPCTLTPTYHTSIVAGVKRIVIDTEGFDDGRHITEEQIHNLAQMLKHYQGGINSIGIVIQAQVMRFTQGVKDVIKFVYDALGKQVITHLCVMFTFCSTKFPNRDIKKNEYRKILEEYIKEISGIEEVPNIPMYFVNCAKPNKEFVKNEMTQFFGWSSSRSKIKPSDFEEVPLGYKVEDEEEKDVSLGCFKDGLNTIERFVDRKRKKITPNNGDQPRFTDWETTREYTKTVTEVKIEERNNQHHSFVTENGKKYEILVDEQRTVTLDYKTGKKTEGPWGEVNRSKRLIAQSSSHEEEVEDKAYMPCEGGYKLVTYKKKRQIRTDPDGNVSYGEWTEVYGSRNEQKVNVEPRVVERVVVKKRCNIA